MKNKKYLILVIIGLLIPIFSLEALSFNLSKKENYSELSTIESKKIISNLPKTFNDYLEESIIEGNKKEEATIYSLLRRSSMFDVWNYALADLPMETTINILRLYSDYSEDGNTFKMLISAIEKQSVKKAKEYLDQFLLEKKIKISLGAIRGGLSGENKEVIFQYAMVFFQEEGARGRIVMKIFSPEEITPPNSKGSYGGAISFVNYLDSGIKIPQFIVEIKGSTQKDCFGNISLNHNQTTLATTLPNNVPDLGLRPISWMQKYIYSPAISFLEALPFVGEILASNEEIKYIEGKGNAKEINSEINEIINQETVIIAKDYGNISNETKAENSSNSSKQIPNKKSIQDSISENSLPKVELLSKEKTSSEGNRDYLIMIIKELIKRRNIEEKEINLKNIEVKVQKIEIEKVEEKLVTKCIKKEQEKPNIDSIIFNEIAWMGSHNNSSHEWIELKNTSDQAVNMQGWRIYDNDDKIVIQIKEKIIISPGKLILLERGEDAVSHISSDIIYSGALSNSNETLYLFDDNCTLKDIVIASPDWPAGDNKEKRTMERGVGLSWHTYSGEEVNSIFGTPKKDNSQPKLIQEEVSEEKITNQNTYSSITSTPSNPITFCDQEIANNSINFPILINEVAWMGTSTSSSDEWIELKNISDQDVSIEDWQLLDKDKNIKVIFDKGETIKAGEFYLLERTDDESVSNISADKIYSGALKDSDEGLMLFDQYCHLIDSVSASPDWPAGHKADKRTMERGVGLSWHTYSGEGHLGIMGSPKQENSINASVENNQTEENQEPESQEEAEENNDQNNQESETKEEQGQENEEEISQENENSQEEVDTEELISFQGTEVFIGEHGNEVVIQWSKMSEEEGYEIYYDIGKSIDLENPVPIRSYIDVKVEHQEDISIATISDLYWNKEYHFIIANTNAEENNLYSEEMIIATGDSNIYSLNQSNQKQYPFGGPDHQSVKKQLLFDSIDYYYTAPVLDSNKNKYIQVRDSNTNKINCYDADGSLKWEYLVSSGRKPYISKDGTIYFTSDSCLFALSPSGKEKWKTCLDYVATKEILIDNQDNIYILGKNEGENKPSLYLVKDMHSDYSIQKAIDSFDIFGEDIHSSQIEFKTSNGNDIYFAVNNILIKYNQEGFEKRVFQAEYSNDYEAEKNIKSLITNISLSSTGDIFIDLARAYISPNLNFRKIIGVSSEDLQGDYIFNYMSESNTALYLTGIKDNFLYIGERKSSKSTLKKVSLEKEVIWNKEWRDGQIRNAILLDSSNHIYITNGLKIISFDVNNINSISGEDDIVFISSMGRSLDYLLDVQVYEDHIFLQFNNEVIEIGK